MSSFLLKFNEEEEAQDFSSLNYCRKFGLPSETLKCGKFEPAILYENEFISFIHFLNFQCNNGVFYFDTPDIIVLSVPGNINIKFTILTPGKIFYNAIIR